MSQASTGNIHFSNLLILVTLRFVIIMFANFVILLLCLSHSSLNQLRNFNYYLCTSKNKTKSFIFIYLLFKKLDTMITSLLLKKEGSRSAVTIPAESIHPFKYENIVL